MLALAIILTVVCAMLFGIGLGAAAYVIVAKVKQAHKNDNPGAGVRHPVT